MVGNDLPLGQLITAMGDLLVKLFELENDWKVVQDQKEANGVVIRKPIGPERDLVIDWVRKQFGDAWASEAGVAISNRPVSCFVAIIESGFAGFACYDATGLGYFGPLGVREEFRKRGIGRALLTACLLDMKLKGYGYAIIGAVGQTELYKKSFSAIEIPDSSPGILKNWVKM